MLAEEGASAIIFLLGGTALMGCFYVVRSGKQYADGIKTDRHIREKLSRNPPKPFTPTKHYSPIREPIITPECTK